MSGGALFPWLQAWLNEHPEVKLIIIDTLQMIRGEVKKNEGVYSYDYREMSNLRKFTNRNDLTTLAVHHTKKGIDDSDFLSNMSGSNGISGALDFALCLSRKNRKDDTTVLDITGRDILTKSFVILFNNATTRWENLGEAKEVKETEADRAYAMDPLVKTIRYNLDLIEELSSEDDDEGIVTWRATSQELSDSIQQRHGHTDYDSSVSVGMRLKDITPLLASKDGIRYEKTRVSKDGKQVWANVFKRERVT